MNKNFSLVINLILYGFLQQIVAGSLNCNNKDAVECKAEFVKQLDLQFQEFHVKIMEKEITDTVKVFNAVLADLPANDEKAKMLKTSINELEADKEKIKHHRSDYEETRAIIRNMEINIQPHVMVEKLDKKTLTEFEKLLNKHGYSDLMEKHDFNEFINAFTKMWIELFPELRPSDVKEFPAYSEINEKMKAIGAEQDQIKREKLVRDAMKKVRDFCKIPFLEEVIFYEKKSSKH